MSFSVPSFDHFQIHQRPESFDIRHLVDRDREYPRTTWRVAYRYGRVHVLHRYGRGSRRDR